MAGFDNRPRMSGQTFPDANTHSEAQVADFLAMGTWNGLTVSFYRDQNGGITREHLPPHVNGPQTHNFDFSTLILGAGFQNVFYRLDANGAVNIEGFGAPLPSIFATYLLFNIESASQPRKWLRLAPIHPDDFFPEEPIEPTAKGGERCIQLITYPSDDQELFKVFRFEGELAVNAWETNLQGVTGLRSKTLLQPGEAGCFMQFMFADNSFVYYFFPEGQLTGVLQTWHDALQQAGNESRAIMGAVDDPIFHYDDFCICFTELVTPAIGIVII